MAADEGVQFSGSRSGIGDFPVEWGIPPAGRFSKERLAWVRTHARQWESDSSRGRRYGFRLRNNLRLLRVVLMAEQGAATERRLRAKGLLDED